MKKGRTRVKTEQKKDKEVLQREKSCKMKQNGDNSLRCGTQEEDPGLNPTTACPLWSFALYVSSMMKW